MVSYSWKDNADGDWNTTADWSPSGPPTGVKASVTISTANFHTITLNSGTYTIGSLTLGNDELLITNGSVLNDYGRFTGTGTLSVQSGFLSLDGGGTASAAGITLGAAGTLDIAGATFYLGSGTINSSGLIELESSTISDADTLTLTGTLQSTSGVITGGGRVILDSPSNNRYGGIGSLSVRGGDILENKNRLTLFNGERIELGQIGIDGTATTNGQLVNDAGATLRLNGYSAIYSDGTADKVTNAGVIVGYGNDNRLSDLENTGTVEVAYGALSLFNVSGTGILSVKSGYLGLEGNNSYSPTGIVIGYGGTLSFVGRPTFGSGTLSSQGTVRLDGEVTETGTLTLTGLVAVDEVALYGAGSVILAANSTVNNLKVADKTLLENRGAMAVSYEGKITLGSGGTFLNAPGATLLLEGSDIGRESRLYGSYGSFINAGLLLTADFDRAGLASSIIEMPFTNSGLIEVPSYTLVDLGGSLTNTGEIQVGADATLLVEGGCISNVAGLIVAPLGTLALDPEYPNITTFISGSGTIGGDVSLRGAISAAGTLTLAGALTVFGGAFDGGGRIVLDAASTVYDIGIGVGEIVENSSTLTASYLFESGGALNIAGGTLLNDAGATIDLIGNTGASARSAFVNAGTLVSNYAHVDSIAVDFTNTGMVRVLQDTLELTGLNNRLLGTIEGAGTIEFGQNLTILGSKAHLAVAHASVAGGTLALAGDLTYAGSFLESVGTLALSGRVLTLDERASFTGGAAQDGYLVTDGHISLSQLTLDEGAIWQDSGTVIDTGSLTLGNSGGGSGRLFIFASGILNLVGNLGISVAAGGTGRLTNQGLLEKTFGQGVSRITPVVENSGSVVVERGTIDFLSAVTGTGTSTIDGSSGLEFAGSVASSQTVAFGGSDATLALHDIIGFKAKIEGFDQTANGDAIYATTFTEGTTVTFTQPASGEVVATLTDGGLTAKLMLFGQYTLAGFVYTASATGTTITYPQPAQEISLASTHH